MTFSSIPLSLKSGEDFNGNFEHIRFLGILYIMLKITIYIWQILCILNPVINEFFLQGGASLVTNV